MTRRIFAAIALASAAVSALAGNAMAQTIANVEAQASGTAGTINDAVITAILSQPETLNGRTYTNWAFLANDGTGSIDVFGHMPSGSTYVPAVGDAISLAGTYSPFDGFPEIDALTSITQLSSGNAIPAIATTTIPTLDVATQPLTNVEYVFQLNDVAITSGTSTLAPEETWGASTLTFTVSDYNGNSMELFYWPTSYSTVSANLFGQTIPSNQPVDMTGFVSTFTSGGVTTPEFNILTVTPVPEPSTMVLFALGLAGLAAWGRRRRK